METSEHHESAEDFPIPAGAGSSSRRSALGGAVFGMAALAGAIVGIASIAGAQDDPPTESTIDAFEECMAENPGERLIEPGRSDAEAILIEIPDRPHVTEFGDTGGSVTITEIEGGLSVSLSGAAQHPCDDLLPDDLRDGLSFSVTDSARARSNAAD